MLSNPLQRFSPYNNLPSPSLGTNGHPVHAHAQSNGIDVDEHTSHYGFPTYQQHQQQSHDHAGAAANHLPRVSAHSKQRHSGFGSNARSAKASGPVRRRISRACDQCNQLRTKCDGQHPCAHCLEFGLSCEYQRERKKRGKASRKELAQQAAAQAVTGQNVSRFDRLGADGSQSTEQQSDSAEENGVASIDQRRDSQATSDAMVADIVDTSVVPSHGQLDDVSGFANQPQISGEASIESTRIGNTHGTVDLNGYGHLNQTQQYDRQDLGGQLLGSHQPPYDANEDTIAHYSELPYNVPPQQGSSYNNTVGFRIESSPLGGYAIGGPISPGWTVPLTSPSRAYPATLHQPHFGTNSLKYPVLEPLLPHLGNLIPINLACDLLDLYFSSSSSAKMHPMSPYVLGFVFRKRAFLHPTRPRKCQPALLASMLWVAAQTSDAPFLTSMPSSRSKTCQKLLELTVTLLKPLIHNPANDGSPATSPAAEGVALGGLGVALPGSISMDALTGESGAFGAAGTLDDAATYIHLATVVSASEYKGASLRWWNAAWSLARELKLGRELPPNNPVVPHRPRNESELEGLDEHDILRDNPDHVSEEEREERRRIWWLAYIVDRHLALCYNRPLFLLDAECAGLLQPLDDTAWQSGDFQPYSADSETHLFDSVFEESTSTRQQRTRGPSFECRGHSIFGYFLPLMTILGEIVDLHHVRNHPRFGAAVRSAREWDDVATEISHHLEAYENSLKRFEQQHLANKAFDEKSENMAGDSGDHQGATAIDLGTPSVHSVRTNGSNRLTESDIQARIVMAYGTHVMHVLHILLAGKWDPINLLDDEDLWISTQGFITATGHAVSAAEAISQILEFDPGLEFMPFFFGIYLLQGSFLLLLIADKLQSEASPSVVKACETIVRAHEACVVTLNTEYQRNYSKVMRSALAQVRGRVPEDLGEQQQRRRELLGLYRWAGDGTGLAL